MKTVFKGHITATAHLFTFSPSVLKLLHSVKCASGSFHAFFGRTLQLSGCVVILFLHFLSRLREVRDT